MSIKLIYYDIKILEYYNYLMFYFKFLYNLNAEFKKILTFYFLSVIIFLRNALKRTSSCFLSVFREFPCGARKQRYFSELHLGADFLKIFFKIV